MRLLFLQDHWETDRFFADSEVHLVHHDRDQFHFRRVTFSSQIKSRVGLVLDKGEGLRITLNLDGTPSHLNHTLTHHTRKLLVY